MARKVFISVLGSTNYGTCKYEFKENGYLSHDVRFIQEATLEMFHKQGEWNDNSVGFICVTEGDKGSLRLNWKDNGHKDNEKNVIQSEGLQTRIIKLNLPFEIKQVPIKEGNTKSEIWEVFDTVFKLLNDDDELYFDITHGFRYLPMLILVLSNYAKFLKNIKVKSITYGNYEARDKDTNIAQIIDITSFSVLQDWTSAADNLMNFADGKKLSQVIKSDVKDFFVTESDQREDAKALNTAVNSIVAFTNSLIFVKGADIYNALNIDNIQQSLNLVANSNAIPQLMPIIKKIETRIEKFETQPSILNVFEAVDWCIQSGLIQQAHSILYEGIITYILLELKDNDIYNVDKRMTVSSAFTRIFINKKEETKEHEQSEETESFNKIKYPEIIEQCKLLPFIEKYCIELVELGDRRNYMMHARYRTKSETKKCYSDNILKEYIEKLNSRFKKYFQSNMNGDELQNI